MITAQQITGCIKHSLYLQRAFNREKDLLDGLLADKNFHKAYEKDSLVSKLFKSLLASEDLTALNHKLRLFRNYEMIRIAIRDLTGHAPVEEVINDLSDLAEGLVSGALEWHYRQACIRFGTPIGLESGKEQKMLVIGMGKLGGRELNFSSDIDLIFAYPERGSAVNEKGHETSSEQFFIRLGQALNRSLAEYTEDGFVYRVDMRLRPFGDDGSLAVSFKELANYYQTHGRAWERYALIKARVIAGNKADGVELFNILHPFIFRQYVDYSALESLRELKKMIHSEVIKKERFANVKLGRGGIREIEFIAQSFQLVSGGREKTLQSRSLLTTLQACVDLNLLSAEDALLLKNAYLFLRKVENRLQEWNDQQTHDLPTEELQKSSLAESMGYQTYDLFFQALDEHRELVQKQFDLTFAETPQEPIQELFNNAEQAPEKALDEGVSLLFLQEFGFLQAAEIKQAIDGFTQSKLFKRSSDDSRNRFFKLLPFIFTRLVETDNALETMKRLIQLFERTIQRSVYLVLLVENETAIQNLVSLCSLSQWLTDMLVKTPVLLEQLIDGNSLFQPLTASELRAEALKITELNLGDDEAFMNNIREWKNAQVFKVAASDVVGHLPVMKVSDRLTWIAESVLQSACDYAWNFMQQRHGLPGGMEEGRSPFMIIGYGKLGGIELGYGSDLDVVFLYEGLDKSLMSSGKRALENGIYFTRMAQKVISIMTINMPSGDLYEIDSRLRPNGASGLLVNSLESFQRYQQDKAWTWEHQALVRTRAVIGDVQGRKAFDSFKQSFIQQVRQDKTIKASVQEMRQKMRNELDKSDADFFDLKQGSGGIVDIEFIVQYVVLANAHKYPSLAKWSGNIQLLKEIKNLKILKVEQVDALEENYKFYRAMYHELALKHVSAMVERNKVATQIMAVEKIWHELMS